MMSRTTEKINPKNIEQAFRKSWSAETSWTKKFNPKNPPANQCRVTAAVAHTLLGGKILFAVIRKRPFMSHFWNKLPGGKEIDFTKEQFSKDIKIPEGKVISFKETVSAPQIKKTYPILLARVKSYLKIK